ncbi:MAG: dicarboxylate/amino acid:cation symporter [Treponema sp.]|nr:dicarboxylate/amino acid:cation symporter [Treponema sp.]
MESAGRKSGGPLGWYFNTNLLIRILIGLGLGAVTGGILGSVLEGQQLASVLSVIRPFGDAFIRLLWMIMVPVIASTLIVGAASVSPKQLGKIGSRVLCIYVFTSFLAVGTGLSMGFLFRPSVELIGIATAADYTRVAPPLAQTLLNIIPQNIVTAAMHSPNLLGIIFFTLCFGTAIAMLRESGTERTKNAAETVFNFFDGVAEIMIKVVKGIMQYAPIGVFALLCVVFATAGPQVVGGLVMVIVTCFVAYIFYVVVWYLLICVRLIGGLSISKFVMGVKEAFVTGFVTRSSMATLPVTMECAAKIGLPKNVYSFAVPLGATINMDGTAIYQGAAVVFIATSVGHVLTPMDIGTVLIMATLATIGTAGVPGGGMLMLLMVLAQIGLPAEAGTAVAAAYAMIVGIDALLDMGRTGINVTGDLVYLSALTRRMGTLDMAKWS